MLELSQNCEDHKTGEDLVPQFNSDKEWLETNGLGSYASSTVACAHTRKYHGLLVAQVPESTERFVLFSKFEEIINVSDVSYPLNYSYFGENPKAIEINNCEIEFTNQSHPQWIYRFSNGLVLSKEILFIHNENTIVLKYQLLKNPQREEVALQLRPFLPYRNHHKLAIENKEFNFSSEFFCEALVLRPYSNMPSLYLQSNQALAWNEEKHWYKNFAYPEEKERGYSCLEDIAAVDKANVDMKTNIPIYISVSTKFQDDDISELWELEISRRRKILGDYPEESKEQFDYVLRKSAMDFIVKTSDDNLVIQAGYPWFGSWGRDTMISLPGLFLDTSYRDDYKKVIYRYLSFLNSEGLIPNIIGTDVNDSAYNSVDASLWLFWAVQQFHLDKQDFKWIEKNIWAQLKKIFWAYSESRSDVLRCCSNGLLYSGSEKESWSWMDACVNGKSVIPRYGFLVEINALWYNAVCFLEELAIKFEDTVAVEATVIKTRIEKSFMPVFYNKDKKYLADYVRDDIQNLQLRPNQVLAISLPYSLVGHDIAVEILWLVLEKLFTPFGLRTLDSGDLQYRGHYLGDTESRDLAYHNGTVWPWLLGPLVDALMKVNSEKYNAKQYIQCLIDSFIEHMKEADWDYIPEICDGDAPYLARGCLSQAWSVAELRRISLAL